MRKLFLYLLTLPIIYGGVGLMLPKDRGMDKQYVIEEKVNINGRPMQIAIPYDTEENPHFSFTPLYEKIPEAQNIYLTKLPLYLPYIEQEILKNQLDIQVDSFFQVLIWNVGGIRINQMQSEKIDINNLYYLFADSIYNDIMLTILNDLYYTEDESLTINGEHAETLFLEKEVLRKNGPYSIPDNSLRTKQIQVFENENRVETYMLEEEQFFLYNKNFESYIQKLELTINTYTIQTDENSNKHNEQYFSFVEAAPLKLATYEIEMPSFLGSIQWQFVSQESRPLKNTMIQLFSLQDELVREQLVNEAATTTMESLEPGWYKGKYYVNDERFPVMKTIDEIYVYPNEQLKQSQIVEQINGSVQLNITGNMMKNIELYQLIDEKRVFLQQFDLAIQEQLFIDQLSVGSYYIKVNLDNMAEKGTEITFQINQEIQHIEYNVADTTYEILAETGEYHKEGFWLGSSVFVISFLYLYISSKRKLKSMKFDCENKNGIV